MRNFVIPDCHQPASRLLLLSARLLQVLICLKMDYTQSTDNSNVNVINITLASNATSPSQKCLYAKIRVTLLQSFVKLFFSLCILLKHDAIEISISATAVVAEIYSGLRFWWLRTDDSLWKSRGGAWSTDNHLSKQTHVASTTGHTTQYTMHRCNATAYALSLMDQLSGAKHKTRTTPFIAIRPDWKMSIRHDWSDVARIIDIRYSWDYR